MTRVLAVAAACALLPGAAGAAPRFQDYPAAPARIARSAPPRLNDPESRQYATKLRDAARQPPNFAGHYVLASWGCGASCVMAAAVDARTGRVAWLPFTVCCWPAEITEPLQFRLDSRLLVLRGGRNEGEPGMYYYAFNGKRFIPLEGAPDRVTR